MTKAQVKRAIDRCDNTVYIHRGWTSVTLKKSDITLHSDYLSTALGAISYSDIRVISTSKPKSIATSVTFGSDPELFFEKDGKIVPSTSVVPDGDHQVAQDGFQGELHPDNNSCREVSGNNIAYALEQAKEYANRIGAKLSLAVGVVISDDVWKSVPLSLKRFGCNPTENVHERRFKRVTGLREKFRAGGGHIHIGDLSYEEKKNLPTLVTLMDIIAGNTCVLIDRDEANIKRRENYGRAGEYRAKPYGVEYRVLSNFWLRHYVLWSMASGLVRNAVGMYRAGLADELIKRFDLNKIRKAINENDKDLAMENFLIYAEFIREKNIFTGSGIDTSNLEQFIKWAKLKDPMSRLSCKTVEDSLASWYEKKEYGADGFEKFLGGDDALDEDEVNDRLYGLDDEDFDDDDGRG